MKIFFSVLAFKCREFFYAVSHFYLTSWTFLKVDFLLWARYFFENPYRISRNYMLGKKEPLVDVYGETPLSTLQQIAEITAISSKDIVVECGFGRGRAAFWLAIFRSCQVIGYEHIAAFVINANAVKKQTGIQGVDFRYQSLEEADYSEATVIYLYGLCLSDESIKMLVSKFKKLQSGTRLISISYPLNDYDPDHSFEVMRAVECRFPWGLAQVYFQVVRSKQG